MQLFCTCSFLSHTHCGRVSEPNVWIVLILKIMTLFPLLMMMAMIYIIYIKATCIIIRNYNLADICLILSQIHGKASERASHPAYAFQTPPNEKMRIDIVQMKHERLDRHTRTHNAHLLVLLSCLQTHKQTTHKIWLPFVCNYLLFLAIDANNSSGNRRSSNGIVLRLLI